MELEDLGLDGLRQDTLEHLVYMVGPTRSGTSIINNAIGLHPRHLVAAPVSYFMDRVWSYATRDDAQTLRRRFEGLPGYTADAALDREQRDRLNRYMAECFARPDLKRLFQLLPLRALAAGGCGKVPEQVRCWQTKSGNWRGLEKLRRAFPHARFVFLVRDPRGSILSGARHASKRAPEGDGHSLLTAEIIDFALYWRTTVAVGLRFARRHPDISMIVRFEDFLVDPVTTLNRVFAWTVGEPMAPAALEAALAGLGGGASNTPGESYTGISTAPLHRWRRDLTPEQVALISALTWRTARTAGYDLEQPTTGPRTVHMIRAMPTVRRKLRALAKMLLISAMDRTTIRRAQAGTSLGESSRSAK
ncbi:MAG: sulfotransferase [Rhodospirillales bacterium]|nr:sulfotransferase [Rhodospirillales bacterium]